MKQIITIVLGVCLVALAIYANAEFSLSSETLKDKHLMPLKHVKCGGEDISPHLAWSHAPMRTKSFAITAYDPDAPTGSGWWHWVVFNIPANTNSLPEGFSGSQSIAGLIESRTDYGVPGYGGACPPKGDKEHHYVFTIWALQKDKLPLNENSTAAQVGFQLNKYVLSKDSITATYKRANKKKVQ